MPIARPLSRRTIAAAVLQPDDLRELRAFHKVIADVNRLRIVRRLADGEATVTELIDHVGPVAAARLMAPHAPARRRPRRDPPRGRETVCRLREEAFGEFAARERAAPRLAS